MLTMVHKKLEFPMPASVDVVFDAFHYYQWRARWDSLVSDTHVVGGAPCPYKGAVTENTGAGMLRSLSMRTQFVSYYRPQLAAATMLGQAFPFSQWAASMRHRPTGPHTSVLVYTYTFEVGPAAWWPFLSPVVAWVFAWQKRRRFARLQAFLARHADELVRWQQEPASACTPSSMLGIP
jgi:hypothetical protein